MNIRLHLLMLLVFTFVTGCTAQKVPLKQPVMFASLEDFKLGPKGGVDLVWSTKRIIDAQTLKETLTDYDSLILDQVWVVVDKKSARNLDDGQILKISQRMVKEIKVRLGQGFKLVDVPTENTLRLSIALTNIEAALPIHAVTGRLLNGGAGELAVSKIIVEEHVAVESLIVELLVSDAKTREPLIAVIDTQFGNQDVSTIIDQRDGMKEPIALWADRIWTTLSYWNWIKKRTPNS